MIVIKTPSEIEALYDAACATQTDSKFKGMTYEEGIMAAIDWMTGRAEEMPMQD